MAAYNGCRFGGLQLRWLLSRFSPLAQGDQSLSQSFVRSRPETHSVLYLNFPGEGPNSWEKAYEEEYERTPIEDRNRFPHSYVHPFLEAIHHDDGSLIGYDFVLQYWFFYPSNDGGNNHEGDWEHLNVVVAPRSLVTEPLSREIVERILDGAYTADFAEDPLIIQRVEYYFHHFVMTLDFSHPNVYLPKEQWEEQIQGMFSERLSEREIWKATRRLAYQDDEETVINTHPFGYIGADNKGFDQALAPPGGKNRNSHGTFPFPGRYHNIGPAGATEQISVDVDVRRHWSKLGDTAAQSPPQFERGRVISFADPERLRIVPDWERVVDPIRNNASARRDWSWLVLPIHWGYPASESPLAGLLPHADTGNLAPSGPSFSSGWNVTGAAPGFHAYEPHILPALFPLRPQDGFRNDLGFFNLTLPLLFNLPPLDFLSRLGTYPFKLAFSRQDPVYYPKEAVPYRFVGISSGVSIQTLHENFNSMVFNPQQFDEFIGRLLEHFVSNGVDSTTVVEQSRDIRDKPVSMVFQVPFYIGGKFVSENTVRNMRAKLGFGATFSNIPEYTYESELNYWEYAGSLRYSIFSNWLEPFVKAGYGWSWYRVENAQTNGVPLQSADSEWIKCHFPRGFPGIFV